MDYKLEDLIDIPLLQDLQEKLNVIYSFPSAIVDNYGKVLTAVAWQDICTKFHRKHPECEKECIKSDQYIIDHLNEANPAVSYQCPHGLVDNATPIIIDGKHLGNFFTGQFFLEKPDLEFFKKQAQKYGFDESTYIEAVEKVPIWTKDKLAKYLDFIKSFIEIIAGIGLKNLREIEINKIVKESEDRYRSLYNSIWDSILVADINRNVIDCNPAFTALFGYTLGDIVGKQTNYIYASESDYNELGSSLKEHFGDTDFLKTVNYKKKSGEVFPGETNIFYLKDDNENVTGFIGLIRDITDRKLAENALNESEEKYRKLVELSPDAVLIHIDGIIQFVNSASVKLFEAKNKNELLGKKIIELVHPDYQQIVKDRIGNIVKEELKAPLIEEKLVTLKGNTFVAEVTALPITINKKSGVQVIARDISERKLAEQKIREKDLEFRKLSANVPDLIFQFTRRPDGSYCVPIASAGIKNIFGCSPEDVIDDFTPIANVIHPEDAQRVINDIEYSAEHLTYFTCEFRVVIPGKGIQWIFSRSTPEKLPDGSITWYGFNVNITEQKKVEDALRRSEEELKRAQEITHIGSWYLDLNTNEVVWTEELYKMYGFDPSIPPPPYSEHEKLFTPDSWEMLSASLDNTSKTGVPYELELKTVKKDGSNGWMWVKGESVKNIEGKVIGLWGAAQDITERKLIEEQLKEKTKQIEIQNEELSLAKTKAEETEIQLMSILENSPTGFAINRISTGEVIYVNKTFSDAYHIPIELCNTVESFFEYVYGDRMELGERIIADVTSGDPKRMKWDAIPIVDKTTKNISYVSASNIVLKEQDLMISSVWDITEAKLAEDELRSSKQLIEGIINSIHVRVFWKDKNLVYLGCNTAFANDAGFSDPSEIIGKDDFQMGWHDQAEIYRADDKHVIENGIPKLDIEEPQTLPDGKVVTVLTNKIPLKDSNGRVTGVLGTYMDISNRKLFELELHAEKERAQKYLDIAGVMIAVLNNKGEITLINKKGCEILGYSLEEIINKNWFELCIPSDIREEIWDVFNKLFAGDILLVEKYENTIVNKNGEFRKIAFHNTVIRNEKSEITSILFSGEDITERKKVEEELYKHREHLEELIKDRTAKLLEKNAELERFNKLFVDREFRIKELRDKVKDLESRLGNS